MAKAASHDIEEEQGAERTLIDLVCLLAQQAAREAFAEERQAAASPTSPASPPTKTESDDG